MRTIDKYTEQINDFENMVFEERREAALKLEPLLYHTKKVLKEVFRMKPKHDAPTDRSYKSDYGNEVIVYQISDCIPMRPLSKKPRSEAQIAASERLSKINMINSKQNKIALLAQRMINDDVVIIDTETTDLNGFVIQIAAVSAKTGELLYKSFVNTDQEISEGAFNIHGITKNHIKDAPTFEQVAIELGETIKNRKWSAFNLDFDEEVIFNSIFILTNDEHFEDNSKFSWFKNKDDCLMYLAARYFGSTNRHGSISLSDAMYQANIEWVGNAHDAEADAIATAMVIKYIASNAV